MASFGPMSLARYFVIGVVGLFLTLSIHLLLNKLEETGDRYYRIPLLSHKFQSKQVRRIAMIVIPLSGFVIMAILQPELVQIALSDFRVLSTILGLLIFLILFSANEEPDNWSLRDGSKVTIYGAAFSFLLVFGPWVGPWLLNHIIRYLNAIITSVVDFVTSLTSSIIEGIMNWIASNLLVLAIFLILLAISSYSLYKRK